LISIEARIRGFWDRDERGVLGLNLALHVLVQIVALLFMPLPYYSRLSLHDGNTYYRISQNLWPDQPITLLSWQKRILLPALATVVFPWERHLSFLIIGVGAASLSAVFFFKIAKRYTKHPFRLTILYSLLPWLFFAAHHGLNEPLLMLFLLAGFYYYLEDRPWVYTACFALAMLSKELAALPILAMTVLIWRRDGWRRALTFGPIALFPFALFCLVYGAHWGDCAWCLKESAENPLENSFSLKTGFWWMIQTLRTGTHSSANPTVALWYDVVNQMLNVGLLAATAVGIIRLRKVNTELLIYNAIIAVPLLFLGRNQYALNSSLGRQFLIVSPALLGFDSMLAFKDQTKWVPLNRLAFFMVIGATILLSSFWILLYSKFFLVHRLF
jgi:hypothetical protein